jgi:hypothetical protein
MSKKINSEDYRQGNSVPVKNREGRSSEKGPADRNARNNSIPTIQQDSRSDQEQEGQQNPAGDTRDVDRIPVDNAEHSLKK